MTATLEKPRLTPATRSDVLTESIAVELSKADRRDWQAIDKMTEELERLLPFAKPLIWDRRTSKTVLIWAHNERARETGDPAKPFDFTDGPVEPEADQVARERGGVKFYGRPKARVGSIVIEMAICTPILLTIIMGGLDIGLRITRQQQARHAATVAAVALTAGEANPSVQADLNPYLNTIGATMTINAGTVEVTVGQTPFFIPGSDSDVIRAPYIQPTGA